jgi:hypothetical protein
LHFEKSREAKAAFVRIQFRNFSNARCRLVVGDLGMGNVGSFRSNINPLALRFCGEPVSLVREGVVVVLSVIDQTKRLLSVTKI